MHSRRTFALFCHWCVLWFSLSALPLGADAQAAPPGVTNHVLQLDGDSDYMELPPDVFSDLEEATVEGWVKWQRLRNWSRFFDFGATWHAVFVGNQETTDTLQFAIDRSPYIYGSAARLIVPGLIQTNEWCHIAVTMGSEGARLYFNGVLVASDPFTGSFASLTNNMHNFLGRSNWRGEGTGNDEDFEGQMDEVRVWSGQRSEEEIRDNMNLQLTGTESGLVSLWNFEDGTNNVVVKDAGPGGHDGRLMDEAKVVAARVSPGSSGMRPVLVIMAKDLTEEDHRRLNGGVEHIIQKGAISQAEILELVRSVSNRYVGENI
jgi:hypothetical protein